ncbi:hypothetical protein OAT44_00445 [Alphaproteobacteria bacterium]|nr:hypothetical protein [Alphaproteobacteria bacterium]
MYDCKFVKNKIPNHDCLVDMTLETRVVVGNGNLENKIIDHREVFVLSQYIQIGG